MNIYALESIIEVTRIEAEINSEFIYESILIESDTKKSSIEKIKDIWNKFVTAMKRIIDNIRVFIKSNMDKIKYGSNEVEITDRNEEIRTVKDIISDIKTNMDNVEKIDTSEYTEKVKRDKYKKSSKKMKKYDGVRFYEKQLKEAQDLLKESDNVINAFIKKHKSNGSVDVNNLDEFKKDVKINIVNTAIGLIQSNLGKLIKDINSDLKTLVA